MAGFMGLRGLNPQNPHDKERERREENRQSFSHEQERRAHEKVQEILKDQKGDMSAYTGGLGDAGMADSCKAIADKPVGSIMSARVAALSFDDNLLTVQGIFASVKFRHLPVVDEDARVIGIISDRDFLRVVSPFFGTVNEQTRDKEIMARKAGTIMTRNPVCANMDTPIIEAVKLMNNRKISCLPIVEKGGLVLLGIVTWKDVVRAYCPRAFNPARESNRLQSGVGIDPETSESARLRSRAKESSTRVFVRRDSPPLRRSADDALIPLPGTPGIAATEKLRGGYTAGQAGSDLAARQRALMREQLERQKHDAAADVPLDLPREED